MLPPPASLAQYEHDGTTTIVDGSTTTFGTSDDIVLTFDVSHPDPGHTLTPWVEVSSTGAFTEDCGDTAATTFSGTLSRPIGER